MNTKITPLFVIMLFIAGIKTSPAQKSPGLPGTNVSTQSSIRFNPHILSEEQIKQANEQYHQYLVQRDPQWDQKRNDFEQKLQQVIANSKVKPHPQAVVTLPVVVHVVYNTAVQNISNAQVLSQITVLNQDFARTNPDTVNTPAPFAAVAANTGIQFCLAQRDPAGNPTTGIERRQTTVTQFGANDAVKFFAQGGLDIWDPTRYLNIWVCTFGNTGLLGYGEFPTATPSNTYGVVIQYDAFGNTGTVTPPFNLGRTCTHEFSHCFNLYHIWGDDGTACTGTDYCADTPNQAGATTGCFTFPHIDGCAGSPAPNAGDPVNGIMYMNYMDYSDDNCLNIFTQNQSTRMNAVLSTAPYNALTTSNGCQPVVLSNNDAGILSITTPNGNICSTSFTPVIVLKNFGANALTSCTISYRIDATAPSTYSWTGNLASLATATVTLGSMTTTAGTHTFTASTSMPNGVADSQPSNDQATSNFTVYTTGSALPYSQGFEATTFVPTGWTLYNPDNGITWARTTQAASGSTASAYVNNFAYSSGVGQRDEMITLPLNLSTVVSPVMTFEYAYTYYNQTTPPPAQLFTDTLTVLISTDCGQTWSQLYTKGGVQLATATPTPNAANEFIPTASQWGFTLLSLSAYQSATNAMIKFRNTSDYGDQLYIDNINIQNASGVSAIDQNFSVFIYPNPGTGQFILDMNLPGTGAVAKIYDVLGRETGSLKLETGINRFDLSTQANGIYFVRVIKGEDIIVKKIVLEKK